MARTKKAARKQASNYSRETIKEHSKQKQEVKKAKKEKKNKNSTPTQAVPSNTQITGSGPTDDMSIDPPASTSKAQTTSSANTESLGELASTHDVLYSSIISSSQIEKKVTAILKHLSTVSDAKPAVVMLHSKAKVASKLISVVEIAKREIAGGGEKWFQYNAVEGVLEERAEEKEKDGKEVAKDVVRGEGGGESMDVKEKDEEDEEEEESFETMKTPFERAIEGKAKVRAVPGMTTYLSRVRIEVLRKKYG